MKINYNPVGIIHTPFKDIGGMPIQPVFAKGINGIAVVKEEFTGGLLHLDGFSHIILVYHFHRSKGFKLQVVPFLDNRKHGVFATRAPKRPNAIGISVVRLISMKDNVIEFENADMLDGTPLLDIKPYIAEFDIHQVAGQGWMEDKSEETDKIRSDERFR